MKKLIALLLVLAVLAACAAPAPMVVEKEVPVTVVKEVPVEVEKEVLVEVVKEVPVEVVKEVSVEKEVIKEVEVVVTATPLPAAPTELRVGISTEPWDLDPAIETDTGSGYIIQNIYDPLIELDVNREPTTEFALAESWEWNDDTTVLTVKIREGVKFHDGSDLDAVDVKYNIDWQLDPENEAPNVGSLGPIESVEVIDDYTFKTTFTDPYPDAVLLWAGVLDGIVPEGSHGERSDEKGVAGFKGSDLSRAPIGTGPFKFVEWVSGSHITLEKFDDYWVEGVPAMDRVVFEIMPDDAAKEAALVSGAAHIIDKVPFRDFETISSMPGIVTARMPGIQTQILYLNLGAPPFGIGPDQVGDEAAIEKALNLRKFLYHAVDRQQILDRLFYGMGTIQLGPWFPDSDWTSPKLKEMTTYDPVLAQEYLEKSGYAETGLDFRMMCTNAQWFCDVSTVIQEQLRPYGVNVEVIPIDKSAFFDTMYETFDWDVGMEDWGQGTPLALNWLYYHSYRNNHNHNHWHHADADLREDYHETVPGHDKFVELWDQANVEPDEQKRKELVWEMEEMVTFDVIQVDLMWLDNLYAWRDSVEGYSVTPDGDINLKTVTAFTD